MTPSISYKSEEDYNNALLEVCLELGIEMIAVTDHWCSRSGEGLLRAAKDRGICALPGFEANSSEGIHLLVIFEEGTALTEVDAAIGMCGVKPGCKNGELGHSFDYILRIMSSQGALVIPAHANVPSGGMLTSRSGRPLEAMATNEKLHAIAISPDYEDGKDQELILKGTAPYTRTHPLTRIHSDDVSHADHLRKKGASTWFKSSSRSLQGLKLAVRTPETRVSLEEPHQNHQSRLESIRWTGGYLDGIQIPVCSDLTALIGGRGAGKSTVIESIRYAVAADFLGKRTEDDGHSIVRDVLKSGTVVDIGVKVSGQNNGVYRISRTVPEEPIVYDAQGKATELKPFDILGDIEIYGQHELAELAASPNDIATMVRRFTGQNNSDNLREIKRKITSNRQDLRAAEEALFTLQEALAAIPRLEDQMRQYSQNKVSERLESKQRIDEEKIVIQAFIERLTDMQEGKALADLTEEIEALKSEMSIPEYLPNKQILNEAEQVVTEAAANISKQKAEIDAILSRSREKLDLLSAKWLEVTKPEIEQHAETLRNLNQEGLEPDNFIETSQKLQTLKAQVPKKERLEAKLQALEDTRARLLENLQREYDSERSALVSAIQHANQSTNGVVVVKPVPNEDRSHFHEILSRHIEGRRDKITPVIEDPKFDPKKFAETIREGAESLGALGITPAQAQTLVSAGNELIRDLEETRTGTVVDVLLKVPSKEGSTKLKSIGSLSKGQRATALLLLLLGASDSPLVIDQPEDDLDNRFVFDGVVSKLRSIKGKRQVLASTHNANIPVLGDAEQIVVLEGDGSKGGIAERGIGSLDNQDIRAFAEDILEGGSLAFRARHHLYGF